MQSIIDLAINLNVDYVRRHKHQLEYFFEDLQSKINAQSQEPLLAYTIDAHQFDEVGTLWVDKRHLDSKSLRLIQLIESSYMSTSFFSESTKAIGSRGYIYYSPALEDDDAMRAMLRLINHANTSIELLSSQYPVYKDRWEFGVYALLDDIRYKLLIIDECLDALAEENQSLLDTVALLFYDYLQGIMPTVQAVEAFTNEATKVLTSAIHSSVPLQIRSYKEADHPLYNLKFRDQLVSQLNGESVDAIIGIRFGGSELPHIVRKYLPAATIVKVRVSNYSGSTDEVVLPSSIGAHSKVLILDDNILTGRTLQLVIASLKKRKVGQAYFGCVTYSGMKRYPQMIMKDHGVVNTDVLRWSCVVGESQYTRIRNSRSYKNDNGVFDKVKSTLQRRMNDKIMRYKL